MRADDAALLWLRAFQRLAERAAHEIKNPLNGAVLNVEVVRGRAGRAGTRASTLASYAEAGATELGRAVALVEALLALARPVAVPVDLDGALAPLLVLARAIAEARGGALTVERLGVGAAAGAGRARASLDGDALRGAVAAALDAAIHDGATVHCAVEPHEGGAVVHIRSSAGSVTFPDDARAALRGAGVRLTEEPGGVALVFAADRANYAQTQGSDEGRQDSHSR